MSSYDGVDEERSRLSIVMEPLDEEFNPSSIH
jgi:hypothetical protein